MVYTYIFIPETKNIPLEEMGAIFGDEVAVYAEDLHVDNRTHELIIDEHGVKSDAHLTRVATEAGVERRASRDGNKVDPDHPSTQHISVTDLVEKNVV